MILVTGGTGFLGRVVCKKLLEKDYSIVVPTRKKHLQDKISNIIYIKECNLLDRLEAYSLYAKYKPEMVIHLAADVGGIGANIRNPGLFFYNNMQMGLNLIDITRYIPVKKFIMVGTVCLFPKYTPVPFREDDIWEGYPEESNAPYGIAKKTLLVMLQAYRKQFNLNGVYLIPVNLYGPGDNFDLDSSHVIPAIIRKCVEAKKEGRGNIDCWGTGGASREFLYVDDCADGIIQAMEKYDGPDPVNLGNGCEIRINQLVDKISVLTGFNGIVYWDDKMPDGQPRRCLNVSRAKKLFGWEAKVGLDDGLKRTIDWYISQLSL